MNVVRFAWISAIAVAAITLGGHRASAQQYYGYASQQSPAPSGQAAYPCQPCQPCQGCVSPPPPPCQPEHCGCQVDICPRPPCQACIPLPPIEHPPACQAAPCVIDECAPTKTPIWVTVHRNHYIPIQIVHQPAPDVQPVNIQVKWRDVCYLCDCPPGTTQCPHVPGGTPQSSASPRPASESAAALAQAEAKSNASANLSGQANPSAGPTAEKTAATPASSASPRPASESAAALAQAAANPAANTNLTGQADSSARPTAENTAATPAKQWIWLSNENRYGYGFINEQGLAIVDPATRTTTPPTVAAAN
jgi:hypothetical protein